MYMRFQWSANQAPWGREAPVSWTSPRLIIAAVFPEMFSSCVRRRSVWNFYFLNFLFNVRNLAPLGIMLAKLRNHFKLTKHHSNTVPRGSSGTVNWASIMPRGVSFSDWKIAVRSRQCYAFGQISARRPVNFHLRWTDCWDNCPTVNCLDLRHIRVNCMNVIRCFDLLQS